MGVNVAGRAVLLGDGHYSRREGESCGTAVEGAMDIWLIVDLIKGGGPGLPRIETDDYSVMVGGGSSPAAGGRLADQARGGGQGRLWGWLERTCTGWTDSTPISWLTQVSECPLANVVDVNYSSVTKVRKRPAAPADAYEGVHRRLRGLAGTASPVRAVRGQPARRPGGAARSADASFGIIQCVVQRRGGSRWI